MANSSKQFSVMASLLVIFFIMLGCMLPASAEPDTTETKQMTGKCICSTSVIDHKPDIAEIKKLAEQGDPDAQRNLGLKYEKGNGLPQDDIQAVEWYRKAAEQGDTKAQWFLGGMYDDGKGVAQEDKQALFWYGKAAEQGSLNAQLRLGEIFAEGHAVSQNDVVAYAWYSLAITQGDEIASRKRGIISSKFTPEQLNQAQTLAIELQTKIDKHKKCNL